MFSNKLQTNPSSRPRHRLPLTVALSATLAFASVPVAGTPHSKRSSALPPNTTRP